MITIHTSPVTTLGGWFETRPPDGVGSHDSDSVARHHAVGQVAIACVEVSRL